MTSPAPITNVGTADGKRLALHQWPAHEQEPPGVATLLVHGYGEHLGRYHHVAEHLNQQGISVLGVDLRGHGLSEGARGHVARFQEYHLDLDCALEQIQQRWSPRKIAIVGHSMGGLLTCDWLLHRPDTPIRTVVLSSPYLGLAHAPPDWVISLIMVLSRALPRLPLPAPLSSEDLCRDPELVRQHARDKNIVPRATAGWFRESTLAGRRVMTGADRLRGSILVLYGGADRIASADRIDQFVTRLQTRHESERIPDAFHEILNEPPELRAPLLERISRWILDEPRPTTPTPPP